MWLFGPKKIVRTRTAPSPTGMPHLGNIRTALFDYLYAKSHNGAFVVRIEDTDQKRSVDQAVENYLTALRWLGLEWDEGPDLKNDIIVGEKGEYPSYWQSRRLDLYKKYSNELLAAGDAYYCFCTPEILDEMRKRQLAEKKITKYDGRCRELTSEHVSEQRKSGASAVVRLKMPRDTTITFEDVLRGKIAINSSEVEDQVIMKSDGYPTYHLASVVDDHLMNITHVLRGEEWIASTPKHVYLYEKLGWKPPVFVHLPLVLGPNKQKLSKRDGSFSVQDLQEAGYLPEAIVNYLAFLGWHKPNDDREFFTLTELVSEFTLEGLNKSPAVFDRKKLDWYNAQYMKRIPVDTLAEKVLPYVDAQLLGTKDDTFLKRLLEVEQSRYERLTDVRESTEIYLGNLSYEADILTWKDITKDHARANLEALHSLLQQHDTDQWTIKSLEHSIKEYIASKELSNGEILWPLRVSLTGRKQSPGPFESAYILGKDESLSRIATAIEKLT